MAKRSSFLDSIHRLYFKTWPPTQVAYNTYRNMRVFILILSFKERDKLSARKIFLCSCLAHHFLEQINRPPPQGLQRFRLTQIHRTYVMKLLSITCYLICHNQYGVYKNR